MAMHDHGSRSRQEWLVHLADHVGAAMLLDRASALDLLALVFQSSGCIGSPFAPSSLALLDEAGRACELLAVAERMKDGVLP